MSEQPAKQNEPNSEELEKKKSLKYFHGEVGAEAVGEASNAYAPASLIAAGAGSSTVAMLSTLNNFVAAFLYTKVPSVIQRMGSRKRAVLLLAFLDGIGWLPLIAILVFFKPINPLWLIPCWIFNLIPGMLLAPARSSWLVDIVPTNVRGRYFGLRAAISGAVYIGTFFIFSGVLELFHERELIGFALLFFVAFVADAVCFLFYAKIHNTPVTPEKGANFGFFDFLSETRQRNLGKFILFVASFQFAVYIASPFFAPYMLLDLQFTYIFFALIFASEFLAKVLIVTFWGKYADKVGNLKVMKIVSFALPFVPLLWLVSHNVFYLVAVQLFSGVCWAGFDLCSGNFIYEAAPQGKRLKYIAYHKALTTAFMAMGALIGAYLLGIVRPVLGYNILALFVLSGVLRFAITMVMFPKLKEVRGTMRSALEQPVMVTAPTRIPINRPALLHRPREWARFNRSLALEIIPIQNQTEPVATGRGLFYRPREWAGFASPLAQEAVPAQAKLEPAATSRGLFYRPREWANYTEHPAPEAVSTQAETRSEKVAANWGLFYRPGEWERFGRPQTSAAAISPALSETETEITKRGLFHKAHGLLKSSKPAANPEGSVRLWGRLHPSPVLA